ncbi:MAG: hypothetical protein LUE29_02640 [Lachnospiraceae bacterium]|nr:hypothetical protein [Lachnospiraceae bacterium]
MREKKIPLIMVGILFLGLIAGAVLYFSLSIETVTVEGSERYTDEEIESFLFTRERDYHTIVFWLQSKFGEHVSIPFVEDYDIEMTGTDTVHITVYEKSLIGYVTYMGSCFYLDKDGYAVESSDEPLEDVPYVTGLDFDYIILNEKLPVENEDTFDVLLNVAQQLKKYELSVDRIYVASNLDISVYIGNVKVNLGNDDMLTEKIAELKDISANLTGYSGTLDMTEYKEDNSGYILKLDNYLGSGSNEDSDDGAEGSDEDGDGDTEGDGEDSENGGDSGGDSEGGTGEEGGSSGDDEEGDNGDEETTSINEDNALIEDEVGINYMEGDERGSDDEVEEETEA